MHNRNGEILVTTQVCIKSLQQTFYNNIAVNIINKPYYYMALSHKDWELPNSRIWLAKMDTDRGLDFPI